MAAVAEPRARSRAARPAPRGDSPRRCSWRWRDRLALRRLRGRAGIALCLIAAAIVIYMGVRGIAVPATRSLLFTRPQPGLQQHTTGGILDPLIGTVAADA